MVLNATLNEIGVEEVRGVVYGNYNSITSDIKDIEAYVITERTSLIVRNSIESEYQKSLKK